MPNDSYCTLKRRVEVHVGEYENAVRPQMLIQQTITQDRADKTKQTKKMGK
jgi:hypothetical protein